MFYYYFVQVNVSPSFLLLKKVEKHWSSSKIFKFLDSVFNSPRVSVATFSDGVPFELPSARKVSNTMTSDSNRISSEHTVLVMQMGQVNNDPRAESSPWYHTFCRADGEV